MDSVFYQSEWLISLSLKKSNKNVDIKFGAHDAFME